MTLILPADQLSTPESELRLPALRLPSPHQPVPGLPADPSVCAFLGQLPPQPRLVLLGPCQGRRGQLAAAGARVLARLSHPRPSPALDRTAHGAWLEGTDAELSRESMPQWLDAADRVLTTGGRIAARVRLTEPAGLDEGDLRVFAAHAGFLDLAASSVLDPDGGRWLTLSGHRA